MKRLKANSYDFASILEDYNRDKNIMSRNMMRQKAGVANALGSAKARGNTKPKLKVQRKGK